MRQSLERTIQQLEQELAQLEEALEAFLKAHPALQAQQRRLRSVPGVGARSVLRLLVLLYRFYALTAAQGTAKQLVAFLGLDPVPIAVARKILVGRGRSFAPVDLSRPLLNPFLESYSLDFHERISRSPEGL